MTDIRRLDLNLLVAFDAIMRRGNVSRAAAELGLSQSTMSNSLKRLRDGLGDPLFVRESHGVAPTPFAERLRPYVETALTAVRDGLEETREFDPETAQRTFNIIMTDIAEAVILPRVLDMCRAPAPGIAIRAVNLPIDRTAEALRSGEADLAIGFLPDFGGQFYQRFLFATDYVCIAAADNPVARGKFTLEKYLAARHAVPEAPGTGHSVVQQTVERLGIDLRVGALVPHFLSVPFVVASSDLVATIPRAFVTVLGAQPAVKTLPHPLDLPKVEIRLLWHERFHADAASRWLRDQLVTVFRTVKWD
jgi:DNA-binding transcriptional LysR family regulator